MKLTLTTDDGEVLEQWYIPDLDYTPHNIINYVEMEVPCYGSKADYEFYMNS